MKNRGLWFCILVVAILTVVKIFFFPSKDPNGGKPAGKGGPAANVTIKVLKPDTLDEKIIASGSILANEEVELSAEASGKVQQILFREGDKVTKGQLLLKLNDAELVAQQKKLQLQLQLANDMEARQKKLLDIKGISQQEYEAALNQVNSLKADLEINAALIAKTEVRAPFSGIIGLKSVSEGSYVSPTVKIASMMQVEPVKIDFSIPERYAGNVGKGNTIRFTVQGMTEVFEGQVYAVEPKIDPATRTLQLRAGSPNKEGKLVPGSFARIELVLSSGSSLMVPTEAVMPELKGQKVYLYKNGKAESAVIVTGTRTEREVAIVSGLQAGDTVIVTGILSVRPGGAVKIVN